jgi:hypothetical protein
VNPGGASTNLDAPGTSIDKGISLKIHRFPGTTMFATSSVPVPGTEKGPGRQDPSSLFRVEPLASEEENRIRFLAAGLFSR